MVDQSLREPSPSFAPVPLRRGGNGFRAFTMLSVTLAITLAILALYPLSRVLLRAVWVDGAVSFSAFSAAFDRPDLALVIFNTAGVVLASGALALAFGGGLAWLIERTDAQIGTVGGSLPLINLVLPHIASAIGWVFLISPRAGFINVLIRQVLDTVGVELAEGPFNIYSWPALIFVYTLSLIPLAFLMIAAGLHNMDSSLEEQSRMSGAGAFKTFWRVTLPCIRPNMLGAIFLLAGAGLGLFSVPAIIGGPAHIEVLSLVIVRLLNFSYPPDIGAAVGLGMIVLLVLGTIWLIQSRALKAGRHATVGGKGQRATRVALGAWRPVARAAVVLYVLVAAVLPVAALLIVTLNGFWTANVRWSNLSVNHFYEAIFGDAVTLRALSNSLELGFFGATIGMIAAAVVSIWTAHSGGIFSRVVDAGIKFPATASHLVLAIGFILAFGGPPFNLGGTTLMLLIAYIVMYMPPATIAADAAVAQVGRDLPEASSICGASGGKTFLRIYLPLMLPGLIAGWALLFVQMVGDLSASAMLAGTNNEVVGFRILEIYTNGTFALLAALAIALTLISSFVLVTVVLLAKGLASRANVKTSLAG